MFRTPGCAAKGRDHVDATDLRLHAAVARNESDSSCNEVNSPAFNSISECTVLSSPSCAG